MTDAATVIEGEDGMRFAHLAALRGAVRLEALGMKRRGRSATAIAKQEFGIKGGRDKVIVYLEAEMERMLRVRRGHGEQSD